MNFECDSITISKDSRSVGVTDMRYDEPIISVEVEGMEAIDFDLLKCIVLANKQVVKNILGAE